MTCVPSFPSVRHGSGNVKWVQIGSVTSFGVVRRLTRQEPAPAQASMWPGREAREVSAIRASRLRIGSRRDRHRSAYARAGGDRRERIVDTTAAPGARTRGHTPVPCLPATVAPDAGEGLPATVVERYLAARSMPARLAAMSLAAVRPAPLRRALAGVEVIHYPLTIRIPPLDAPSVITLHDLQHLDLPQLFSRGERPFRALAYHRSARSAAVVVCPSTFVAERATVLLELPQDVLHVIPHGVDHTRFHPAAVAREPFLLYRHVTGPTRTIPASSKRLPACASNIRGSARAHRWR